MPTKSRPSLGYSIFVMIFVVLMISSGMIVFGGSIQLMLFTATLAVIPFVMRLGFTFTETEEMMFSMMIKAFNPILIIISVGALIGAWILSGTVPTMIYFGLKIVSPEFFLVTSLLFCSIVSIGTGTSFGTMGTAGLALIGMGEVLGINPGLTAGAIITGAYFGDKMSPLSDSTNMAAAMSGANLFSHVKHMLWTTTPAYILTAILFILFDFKHEGVETVTEINIITEFLQENFHLGIIPLLPILILLLLLFFKKPAVTSIFIAALAGAIIAIVFQGATITETVGTLYDGYSVDSGMEKIDELLQRGGIASMLGIVALFLFAMGLGGLLHGSGILTTLLDSFASRIKSVGQLVLSTMIISYLTAAIGGVGSFAAAITGTLMQPLFKTFRLKPENLSRIIEDTATQSSVIMPWSINSIFAATTLGVSPTAFIPFCFLAFFTPIFTLIYGFSGFTMTKLDDTVLEKDSTIAK